MTGRVWFRTGAPLQWDSHAATASVFDPDTGETHFLSELPSILLAQVDDRPVTLYQLIQRLDGPNDLADEARHQITAALLSLERAELIASEAVAGR